MPLPPFRQFGKEVRASYVFRKRKPHPYAMFQLYEDAARLLYLDNKISRKDAIRLLIEAAEGLFNATRVKDQANRVKRWDEHKDGIRRARKAARRRLDEGMMMPWDEFSGLTGVEVERYDEDAIFVCEDYVRLLSEAHLKLALSLDAALKLARDRLVQLWYIEETGHELTRSEFVERITPLATNVNRNNIPKLHEKAVRTALDLGRTVPPVVLADYPELGHAVLGDAAPVSGERQAVEQALAIGLPVDLEVLAKYPDLIARYGV